MKRFTLIMSYCIEFTVCALCGWLYEEGLELAVNHAYTDRGVLHLPLLPIYGFGGLLLVLLFRRHSHPLFVFLVSSAITTVLELAASYPLERVLGYLPWWYGEWPCNFEGRISLFSSLIFGGLALFLVGVVHPLCRYLAKKAKPALLCTAGILCVAGISADALISFLSAIAGAAR